MVRLRLVPLTLALTALMLAPCLRSEAQPPDKTARIGFLALAPPPVGNAPLWDAFVRGLRERGWVEGRNLLIERRSADGRPERLPALADELVRLKLDLIIASGASAVRAVKSATTTIPIIIAGAADPVAFGLVASLAHPGGNVTGLSDSPGREIEGKRLQLLKEIVPTASRVALVIDSASRVDPAPVSTAARALGLTLLVSRETTSPEEFEASVAALVRERADALYAPETPVNARYRSLLVSLAARYRLPAMYGSREFVEAGGLVAYGVSYAGLFRRAAAYTDRILRGTRPADLPVEQPTQFELVLNTRTAKALGLSIPPSVLVRVDHLIE
jgi:putative ABC transport system substrate-binding protein